jgi:hypothetical protein
VTQLLRAKPVASGMVVVAGVLGEEEEVAKRGEVESRVAVLRRHRLTTLNVYGCSGMLIVHISMHSVHTSLHHDISILQTAVQAPLPPRPHPEGIPQFFGISVKMQSDWQLLAALARRHFRFRGQHVLQDISLCSFVTPLDLDIVPWNSMQNPRIDWLDLQLLDHHLLSRLRHVGELVSRWSDQMLVDLYAASLAKRMSIEALSKGVHCCVVTSGQDHF